MSILCNNKMLEIKVILKSNKFMSIYDYGNTYINLWVVI